MVHSVKLWWNQMFPHLSRASGHIHIVFYTLLPYSFNVSCSLYVSNLNLTSVFFISSLMVHTFSASRNFIPTACMWLHPWFATLKQYWDNYDSVLLILQWFHVLCLTFQLIPPSSWSYLLILFSFLFIILWDFSPKITEILDLLSDLTLYNDFCPNTIISRNTIVFYFSLGIWYL